MNLDHESPIEELFEDQLTCADLIVLNKTDLLDSTGLAFVRNEVASRIAASLTMIEAKNGEVPASRTARPRRGNRKRHRQPQIPSRDGARGRRGAHAMTNSTASSSNSGPIADPVAFIEKLKPIIAEHDVLRLKGFVDIPGKPMRLLIQAVGSPVSTTISTAPGLQATCAATRLVVIGLHDMDEAAVRAAIAAAV
jgi:cobalamin biosynthesis protein CobW